MKTFEEFIKEVERELVISLTISNKTKKITFDEAKIISKDFLSLFPFEDYEDLFKKLLILSNKHRIIRKVYVNHAPSYFEAKKEFVLKNFRKAIAENDIEKAVQISRRVYYATGN